MENQRELQGVKTSTMDHRFNMMDELTHLKTKNNL